MRRGYWTRALTFHERRWSYHFRKLAAAPTLAYLVAIAWAPLPPWAVVALGAGAWFATKVGRASLVSPDAWADLYLFTVLGMLAVVRAEAPALLTWAAMLGAVTVYLAICALEVYAEQDHPRYRVEPAATNLELWTERP